MSSRNDASIMKHLLFLALVTTSLFAQEPERIRDVIYTKHDGVALTKDVFKPAQPNDAVIIKFVSGGWKSNHNGISDGGGPKAGYEA
jgi:hypothetical protein